MIKWEHVREGAITLLDDEEGINVDAWPALRWLLEEAGNCQDIIDAAESTEGRCYLPEDHGLLVARRQRILFVVTAHQRNNLDGKFGVVLVAAASADIASTIVAGEYRSDTRDAVAWDLDEPVEVGCCNAGTGIVAEYIF